MKIGFIIPFFEGGTFFDRLMNSLERSIKNCSEITDFKILIVDNSVTEYTHFFEDYSNRILYKKPGIKLGYGKACNYGFKYFRELGFDFIQIINQDGYFDDATVSKLIEVCKQDKEIAYASCLPLTMEGVIEPFFIKYYLSLTPGLVTDYINSCSVKSSYIAEKMPGVCFLFRLNGYEESYLFDPKIYMYFEDEDLCRRITQSGKKVVLVPGALFYHQHSHTTSSDQKSIGFQNKLSENYLRIKYAGSKPAALYGLLIDETAETFKKMFRGRMKAGFSNIKLMLKSIKLGLKK